MENKFALINKLVSKPGKRSEVIKILIESGKLFDDNKACILYLVYADSKEENLIWVEDLWTNEEEHTRALQDPRLKPYFLKSLEMLEGKPEQIKIDFAGGKINS